MEFIVKSVLELCKQVFELNNILFCYFSSGICGIFVYVTKSLVSKTSPNAENFLFLIDFYHIFVIRWFLITVKLFSLIFKIKSRKIRMRKLPRKIDKKVLAVMN